MSRAPILIVAVAALGWSSAYALAQKPGAPATFETVNVCEQVTGDTVATATGGKLLDTRPVNVKDFAAARCVYGVDIGGARRTFVIWFNPAGDYDGLRKAAADSVKPVAGIGDEAHMTLDQETKRHTLTTVKRNSATIQVTGEQADWVQAIAKLALAKF